MGFLSWLAGDSKRAEALDNVPILSIDDLQNAIYGYAGQMVAAPPIDSIYTGEKFPGGFGDIAAYTPDYYTLRAKSRELFTSNLYAKGLIDRLVINEINTGLCPESTPIEEILGFEKDTLSDWTEGVENLFQLWSENPEVCDWKKADTFGMKQYKDRREALIAGDILIVLRQSAATKMPMVQSIPGEKVVSPGLTEVIREGNNVKHGVERDSRGRHVAYWVRSDETGEVNRIPAWGEKSGRRIAFLVYGTPKLIDDVRGMPLLHIIMQSARELDRYKASAERKAFINSLIAFFIKRTEDKPSGFTMQSAAVKRGTATVTDDSGARSLNVAKYGPGMIVDRLGQGEEPVAFNSQVDVDFGKFEEVIASSMAWANGIPPEIYMLKFSNNYSASQAAINEFKMGINMLWYQWGAGYCAPIYIEFFIAAVLLDKIKAPGFLEAWADSTQWDVFGAWVSAEWYGSIKPSTDMLKQAKAAKELVANGWATNARMARELTGSKYSQNVTRLRKENEQLAIAMKPLIDGGLLKNGNQETSAKPDPEDVRGMVEDIIEEVTTGKVE